MGVSELSDVFVSYRRVDVEFTKQLVEGLQAQGKEVWIDWEDIPPGSIGFSDDIKRGIEGASAFIAVLSPDYLDSPYCVDMELNYAVELNKKLIPIVYRKFDDRPVPPSVSHINWIYFTPHAGQVNEFPQAFDKVVQALDTDLDYVRQHKRFLLRAIEWDQHERRSSYLLSGDEITQGEHWLASAVGKDPLPTELHQAYIWQSRDNATRRQRMLLTGVSIALVVTVFLAIFALFQRQEAMEARAVAVRSNDVSRSISLASGALELTTHDQINALPMLQESINVVDAPYPVLTERILRNLAYQPGPLALYQGHEALITSVAFSPDGTSAVSGDESGMVLVWNLETGEIILTLSGHSAEVLAVAFSPDGTLIATGSADESILLWDANTGESIATLAGHERQINDLDFNSDGTLLASASRDETVIIWDMETQTSQLVIAGEDRLWAVAFSPDDRWVAGGDGDGNGYIWDATTGEIIHTLTGHTASIRELVFSPDGAYIATASGDATAILWDAETAEPVRVFRGHIRDVMSVDFTPDGQRLLTISEDKTAILWNVETAGINEQFTGLTFGRKAVFAPDGNSFLTIDRSTNLMLWTPNRGDIIHHFDDHSAEVLSVAVSPNGELIATTGGDQRVLVYNINTGEIVTTFAEHGNWVSTLDFSPDGQYIASGDDNNEVYVWSAETGEVRYHLSDHEVPVLALEFSPDGRYLATGGGTFDVPELMLWDMASGEFVRHFAGHSASVRDVAFSPDSTRLVSAEELNVVIVWDVETGDELLRLSGHTNAVNGLDYSPDGNYIVSASFDQSIIVWSAQTGEIINQFFGHTDGIRDVVFASDSTTLLSASDDDTVLMWSINEHIPTRIYNIFADNVNAIAFDPNGHFFVTGDRTGQVIVWRLDTLGALLDWVETNRYVPALSCEIQLEYQVIVDPTCGN